MAHTLQHYLFIINQYNLQHRFPPAILINFLLSTLFHTESSVAFPHITQIKCPANCRYTEYVDYYNILSDYKQWEIAK